MAIWADLREYPLSEMLFFLSSRQDSGWLTVNNQQHEVTFTIAHGQIVDAISSGTNQQFGQRLVLNGVIVQEQLDFILERQTLSPTAPLGGLLVELGMVTPEEIEAELKNQCAELLFHILVQPNGMFCFDADADPGRETDPNLDINPLVLESIRLADEWIEEQLLRGSFVGTEDQEADNRDTLNMLDRKLLNTMQLEPMTCERLAAWADAPTATVRESLRTLYQKDLITVATKKDFQPVFASSELR